jgi:hypothetical protein
MSHQARTTHTVDMEQIAELNDHLLQRRRQLTITAADLGLDGAGCSWPAASQLPATAVLHRVSWDGSPEYPYVHGHFTTAGAADGAAAGGGPRDSNVVDFHTRVLRELSHRLGARHVWGQGSVPDPTAP